MKQLFYTPMLPELIKKYQSEFVPVVEFDPLIDTIIGIDFTANNKQLTEKVLSTTENFEKYINARLEAAQALYAIGGYNEHRTVYRISNVFDGAEPGEEPRRLHLGTDIWGKAGTRVMAPLDATVHSFAFNDRFGDYGATIILKHEIEALPFYTLYGHLNLSSLENLRKDMPVSKGNVFAEFGMPNENGQWPPHLHFQLIADIGSWHGDYPGVCKFSEREKWLTNSPDPNLILQMLQFAKI